MKTKSEKLKAEILKTKVWLALILSAFQLFSFSAFSEITATVYPGYQFSASERPTAANLNLLGRPTILVSGTLGGTNVALAANSVTTTMMSDTLPGSNLVWDASSPRELVIADDGVTTNQLHSGVAGLGLSGGSGSQLRVNVDTNTITITNDVVTLNLTTFSNLVNTLASVVATNVAQYAITNYVTTNTYTSGDLYLTNANRMLINTAHTLGTTPRTVWCTLKCITTDLGYAVNDEVNATHLINSSVPCFTAGANSTNVFVWYYVLPAVSRKDTGGFTGNNIDPDKWKLIVKASL